MSSFRRRASSSGRSTTLYRVFSRFGVLAGLGLVILAAYTLSSLPAWRYRAALPLVGSGARGVRALRRAAEGRDVQDIATPITAGELARSASSRPIIMRTSDPPSYLEWLKRQPPGLVADYPSPLAPNPRWAWKDAFHQQVHEHALWQSPENTKTSFASLRDFAADLGAPSTPSALAVAKVKYVVVHRDRYEALGLREPDAQCGLDLLGAFPSDDVAIFKVSASGDEGFAVRDQGFYYVANIKAWPENVGYRWMPQRSEVLVFAPRDDDVFLYGSAVSLDGSRELDVFDSSGKQIGAWEISPFDSAFRFALPVRKGMNRFVLETKPGAVRKNGDLRERSIAVSPLTVAPVNEATRASTTPPPVAACAKRANG